MVVPARHRMSLVNVPPPHPSQPPFRVCGAETLTWTNPSPGATTPRELDSFDRGGGDDLWAVRPSNGAACAATQGFG